MIQSINTPLASLLLTLLLLAGCGNDSRDTPMEQRFAVAHPVTSVAMAAEGDRLHLAWVEKASGGSAMAWHRVSEDQGESWSPAVAIDTGQPAPDRARRDNDLQLVVSGDQLLLAWQARGEGFMGAGPMVMARSGDAGVSWQPAESAARADEAEAHGFFDLSLDASGRLHAAWLDNRTGQQGLQVAQSDDLGASWSPTRTLVDATCYCCWNRLHHQGDQTHLLYRAEKPRDMALLSLDAATEETDWQPQGPVGDFDWQFDGCPHVGGALAGDGDGALHALVWTGKTGHEGLYHLVRHSGTGDFSEPRALGRPGRHGDLARSPLGLMAAWDEPDQGAIRLARLEEDGFGAPRDLRRDTRRAPQRPLLAATRDRLHVLWTEKSPGGRTEAVLRSLNRH
ncbi:MAG: sialidase family protein [Oleiphilaceae bacterium]|nr:sialidase family protein [Oleiphilaceae bacterium]